MNPLQQLHEVRLRGLPALVPAEMMVHDTSLVMHSK